MTCTYVPCDSEDSVGLSDERNEEQGTESLAKRPRNSEDADESKFSWLLSDIFETDTVLALVDKVRREMSLYKAS